VERQYVAIDLHKKRSLIVRDNAAGEELAVVRIDNDPETLSAALEVLFREQGLETMLGSVAEAMRKYQSADSAQELVALTAEGGANRDRLQQYVVNLAAEREKEYQVMDKEAQRCRGMVLAAPPTTAKKKK